MNLKLLIIFLLFICITGCGPHTYPGLPNLPAKDWLGSEKKEKTPEKYKIYAPDKIMTMDDLVWTAIQDSPTISKGQINLSIQEIRKKDALWEYLPEMHLNYHITNNLTKKNEGKKGMGDNYGETTYETTFSGIYRNPVTTYFSVKVQDELLKTAIVTQRQAITNAIYQIGLCLLDIYEYEQNLKNLDKRIKEASKKEEYTSIMEKNSVASAPLAGIAAEYAKGLDLQVRENKMRLTLARTKLKKLIGLDLNLALKVDAASIFSLLNNFHPEEKNWEAAWNKSGVKYMSDQRVRLEQANVFIGWASYFPNVSIAVNESPGKGQSQPNNVPADQFLHLGLVFPLLDWGKRLRIADAASERKKQELLAAIEKKRDFQEQWMLLEQNLELAKATKERNEQALKISRQRQEAMNLGFNKGAISYAELSDNAQRELQNEIDTQKAQINEARTKLEFMNFSTELAYHYLGDAGMSGN